MEEGALSREMKDEEELARVPSEESVSFQARSHGGTRKNGGLGATSNCPWLELECQVGISKELQREEGASPSGTIVPC